MQADAEVQLKPLQAELDNVRGRLAQGALAPDFGTLAEWAQVHFGGTICGNCRMSSLQSKV